MPAVYPAKIFELRFEDDVIVFPKTAKGLMATVEGKVEEIKLTREEAIEWKRHQVEETGQEFDPSTITGPESIYRIWGEGAVIKDAAPASL